MADQLVWRVWWNGWGLESDVTKTPDATEFVLYVRASAGGIAKLRRYMHKAPGVLDYSIDAELDTPLRTVQEFIDYRRDG